MANITESLREKGAGLWFRTAHAWSPQHFILNCSATGWFVTHTGHGSVIESLSSGIPMNTNRHPRISWPFQGDQPTGAVHLTEKPQSRF
ncbi:putative UDP-glucoronosyl and UDP-glucosyl transferase [Lyophyllum shimeji]|uniref:UDP-glucoronosyl and UDP-glucosyl transferase n=1 Tax=Lyophyllum shimeji TaxID=47721 RepID=A0A9P3PSL7_LYOSH|nr:putative UDP-glucoronosyl and UDP-glucosyl transferase [Lyophyllum shimeji]